MSKEYLLLIDTSVLKTLDKLPLKEDKQVTMKLFSLQKNPFPQDYKKLKGYEGSYRVDQCEYRILLIYPFLLCQIRDYSLLYDSHTFS